ncbi:MAG TPA: NAD-dependent epimerase/dehydratase family protein, partial [Chloroflexota bacterium]|nr:NAD-dependent epimerase/dehydratase family protein [Chloroflexota bacterium]
MSVVTIVFGLGYIGSALVQELLYEGRDVIGVDNFFATDRRAIDGFEQSPTFRFVNGSITDTS